MLLYLPWFFIGYWILKTGLDFYPGPFFMPTPPVIHTNLNFRWHNFHLKHIFAK